MTAKAKNALKQAILTLPPQALPSAGYQGFSQLYQSTPGPEDGQELIKH